MAPPPLTAEQEDVLQQIAEAAVDTPEPDLEHEPPDPF